MARTSPHSTRSASTRARPTRPIRPADSNRTVTVIRHCKTSYYDKRCDARSTIRRWSTRSSGLRHSGYLPVQPDATTARERPSRQSNLSFNLDAANQMLDDAGYTMGPDGVRIDPKSGRPLEFRFFSRASDQNSIDIVPYVSGWMEQIGIKLNAETLNSKQDPDSSSHGQGRLHTTCSVGLMPSPTRTTSSTSSVTCNVRQFPAPTTQLRQLLLQPRLRRAQRSAGRSDGSGGSGRHRPPDASDRYQDQPYIVLRRRDIVEAYSSEWTGFKPQPDPRTATCSQRTAAVVHQPPTRGRNHRGRWRCVRRHPRRRVDRRPRGGSRDVVGGSLMIPTAASPMRTRRSRGRRRDGRGWGTRRYLLSRSLQAVLTLLFVLVFNFFLFRGFGDEVAARETARGNLTPAALANATSVIAGP